MGVTTKIGWTDHTFNFWWGCTKVSEECRHCYIAKIMQRAGIAHPFGGPLRTKHWDNPRRWNRAAEASEVRWRVFTCSMSDFFHAGADAWRKEAWELIRACRALDWLILTKRPERILDCLPGDWGTGYPNVWLGVTCGASRSYGRLDALMRLPAQLRFVSAEPLLERLDLTPYLTELDWVISGCEQARKGTRRAMDLDWVRDIDQQCRRFGKPHFFKQYYRNERGVPCTDGMLDGEVRQAWPQSPASFAAEGRAP